MKEQLASAASSLSSAAANANLNLNQTLTKAEGQISVQESASPQRASHKRTVSSGNFEYAASSPNSASVKSQSKQELIVQPKKANSLVLNRDLVQNQLTDSSPEYEPKDIELQRTVESISPQLGTLNIRDSPRSRQDSINGEKRASSAGTNRRQQPLLPHQQAFKSGQQSTPKQPQLVTTSDLNKKPSQSTTNESFQQAYANQANNKIEIDLLEFNALKDTNEVLKAEVQRLTTFEAEFRKLEKEVYIKIFYFLNED